MSQEVFHGGVLEYKISELDYRCEKSSNATVVQEVPKTAFATSGGSSESENVIWWKVALV